MDYDTCDCIRWLSVYGGFVELGMLAWMQPHGCLAPRDFSVSLNNLTYVKITTVYQRRQNTTQNTLEHLKKVYNNTNPVFSSLAHWFQTSVFLLSRCLQSNVLASD